MAKVEREESRQSPETLRTVSGHLWYEIAMMRDLANDIQRRAPLPKHLANARLESFLIHARALEAFFYGEDRAPIRDTDVFASDFHFRDGKPWKEHRPDLPTALSEKGFRYRANKEIAHLTTERHHDLASEKEWDVPDIRNALDCVWEHFASNLSDALHVDWEDHSKPSIVDRDGDRSAVHADMTGASEL